MLCGAGARGRAAEDDVRLRGQTTNAMCPQQGVLPSTPDHWGATLGYWSGGGGDAGIRGWRWPRVGAESR